jgi:hypothetical protein
VLYDVNNSLIYSNTLAENSLAGIVFDIDKAEISSRSGVKEHGKSRKRNNRIYNNYFDNVNNTLFYSDANNTWNTSRTAVKTY